MNTSLSDLTLGRLRMASRWALFVAILGFVGAGLLVLGMAVVLVSLESVRLNERVILLIGACLLAVPMIAASTLVAAYANQIGRAFREGAPALARAMRSLRNYFRLWTVVTALSTALSLYSTAAGLLGP